MKEMEQKPNACVAEYSMEYGEQDNACDGSPAGLKKKHPTQDQDQARTKSPPLVPVDLENLGDLPQLGQNNTNADIQKEMGSATPAGKEDVGDQDLEQTPLNIIEDIAELCLPQDDSIPGLLPLCDGQDKMDQETGNLVAEDPRGQEMACDDPPMEGEHPIQDEAKTRLSAPLDNGNHSDSPPSGPNNNTTETAGATPKEKGAGAEDLEQAPKIQEDIAELCLPQDDNPSLQDDIIEEEEKLSLPTSLSSQEDGITPRPPPDDEGANMSTKKRIEMGMARKEIGYEGEEEVSQPMSLSSKNDEVQSQAIVSYKDESQQIRKRSIENDVKNFKIKKPYGRQFGRLNKEYLNHCEERESFKTEINSLKKENSKLLNAHRKQCVRFVNYRLESDERHKLMKNALADVQREVNSLKAERNLKPSDGLDGEEVKLATCEE